MQVLQLRMAMAKFQRQVHEKDRALFELELDDETFDSLLEIVKALAMDSWRGQERIALVAQDWQPLVQRPRTVFALVNGVVAERACDHVRLIDATRPDRARVDFYEAYDVGVLRFYEVRDPLKIGLIPNQVTHTGQRPVQRRPQAETVTNVVKQQPHLARSLPDAASLEVCRKAGSAVIGAAVLIPSRVSLQRQSVSSSVETNRLRKNR